jgi:hypothetical protein
VIVPKENERDVATVPDYLRGKILVRAKLTFDHNTTIAAPHSCDSSLPPPSVWANSSKVMISTTVILCVTRPRWCGN